MSKKNSKVANEDSLDTSNATKLTPAKRRDIYDYETKAIVEEIRTLFEQNRKLGEYKGKEFTWEKDKTSTIINKTKLDSNLENLVRKLNELRNIAFPTVTRAKNETSKKRRGPRSKYGKLSQGFVDFLNDPEVKLSPINSGGKTYTVQDLIKSFKTGYSSDKLVMEVLKNYKNTNDLSSLATVNIGKEKVNKSFLGADHLLKEHLSSEFEDLKKSKIEKEKDQEKHESLFDIDNMRYLGTFNNVAKYVVKEEMPKNENITKYEEEIDKYDKNDYKLDTFTSLADSIDPNDEMLKTRALIDTDLYIYTSGDTNDETGDDADTDDDIPPPIVKK
jgi:hypothetical protein